MKFRTKTLRFYLAAFTIWYLGFAFAQLEINPFAWPENARTGFVFSFGATACFFEVSRWLTN